MPVRPGTFDAGSKYAGRRPGCANNKNYSRKGMHEVHTFFAGLSFFCF